MDWTTLDFEFVILENVTKLWKIFNLRSTLNPLVFFNLEQSFYKIKQINQIRTLRLRE